MCKGSSANAPVTVGFCAGKQAAWLPQSDLVVNSELVQESVPNGHITIDDARTFPRELADEMEACGVSGELLTLWAEREQAFQKRLCRLGKRAGGGLPTEVREVALRSMGMMTTLVELSRPGSWFDCALLLDKVALAQDLPIERLPAACGAIVAALKKSDTAAKDSTTSLKSMRFSESCSSAAECLEAMGYALDTEVTPEAIRDQERVVLEAVQWQIHGSTVRSWLSLFCERLDIMTKRTWTSRFEWITSSSHASAGILVLHSAAFADATPQRMASGLFCLFCVLGQLVPLECLRPEDMTSAEWEELFIKSQYQGAPPTCILPPTGTAGMLEALPLVTGLRLEAAKQDFRTVMHAMQAIAGTFSAQPRRTGAVSRTQI